MRTDYYEAYLAHYGVKGMKWGVRRYQPYPDGSMKRSAHPSEIAHPSGLTGKAAHKFLSKGSSNTANKGSSPTTSPLRNKITSPFKKNAMMRAVGISAKDVRKGNNFVMPELSGKDDIMFRKGSIVQHVMATPDKDLDRHLFVAATPEDKANYAGFFASLTKYRNNADTMYKMQLKANETLISPGKKKRVEEFINLYNSDKVNISRELAEFNKREYGGYFKKDVSVYAKQFENMSMKELKSTGYYTFFNSLFSSDYNRNAYFNRLKEQGYNSVVDDNDKRSFMQSRAPLIVFNAQESLAKVKVSELSDAEIRQNMIKWSRMKHDDDSAENYFAHYGVKGMKWGVRHDKPTTSRVTKAKSAYVTAKKDAKVAEKAFSKSPSAKTEAAYDKAQHNRRLAKDTYTNEKIRKAMSQKVPSKRQQTLTKKYMAEGYTKGEAEIRAYKRAKLERNVAIVGGLTVAAAAAYLAYRHYDMDVDKLIPAGTKLQHLSAEDFSIAKDGIYTTFKSSDKRMYRGVFAEGILTKTGADAVNKLDFTVGKSGLKIASEKTGMKVVENLLKNDKNFASALQWELKNDSAGKFGSVKASKVAKKASKALSEGRVDRNVYSVVNTLLGEKTSTASEYVRSGFMKGVNSQGYDAVIDIFDKGNRMIGYGAKAPLIVTNASKIAKTSSSQLSTSAIKRASAIPTAKLIGKGVAGSAAAIYGSNKLLDAISDFGDRKASEKEIKAYLKEHPGTEKTYLEIEKMLEKQRR